MAKFHLSRQSAEGFTIIELLVVMSIIVMMISILLPSLRKARATAYRTVCQSNLRQNFLGMTMYYHDYPQWRGTLSGGEWNTSYGANWRYQLRDRYSLEQLTHMGLVVHGGYLDSGMGLYCPGQDWRTHASANGVHRVFDDPPVQAWMGYIYRIANNRANYHHGSYQYNTRELNLRRGRYIMACPGDGRSHDNEGVNALWQDGAAKWVVTPVFDHAVIDAAYTPFVGADS